MSGLKAIELDAASTSSESTGATLTWSHTVGSKTNRILIVGVAAHRSGAQCACSGVTYNGTAMVKATSKQESIWGEYIETSVWILHNPPSGAHDIVASITNYARTGGIACSYAGAQQSSTADAVASYSVDGQTGSRTFTHTTIANNSWVFEIVMHGNEDSAPDITLASGFTSRGTLYFGEYPYWRFRAGDYGPKTPAGNVTCGATIGGTQPYCSAMASASFAPKT